MINLSIDKGILPFKVRINSQSGILHNLHRPLLEKERERKREVMKTTIKSCIYIVLTYHDPVANILESGENSQ